MFEESGHKTAKIKEPPPKGDIHQVSLQTRQGKTLIGVPIVMSATEAVPKVLQAPVRAALCATGLVARVAGLKIVIERSGQ
jgi:hypothetical protein